MTHGTAPSHDLTDATVQNRSCKSKQFEGGTNTTKTRRNTRNLAFARSSLLCSAQFDTKGFNKPDAPVQGGDPGRPPPRQVGFLNEGNRMRRWLALSLFALGVSSSLVLAQIGTATLTGRVTDPSGAVAPGVSINVVQTGTNFEFTALTNAEGIYRVQSLQPGTYRISFEMPGFKRVVREAVELRVGDTLPVDVVLQVGAASDSIEITAHTQMLETETSATGTVQAGEFLYKMPLYQRYINSTLHLVPGMQAGGYAYGGDLGSYHVAGQRSGAIGVVEDGAPGNDPGAGTATVKPLQNAVAEVKVLTTTLPAEYGHAAGGVIAVVKKTGTNELHGMASGYGRTRSMQHRLFFDKDRTSQPTATAPKGLPGFFMLPDANLGGPVVLPKLYNGRNKTFFFVGYQRLIEKKI